MRISLAAPLVALALVGGCHSLSPVEPGRLAEARALRLSSLEGMELHQVGVVPPAGAPICRAHRLTGEVVRISGDTVVLTGISSIRAVSGSKLLCGGIADGRVVMGGPGQPSAERVTSQAVITILIAITVVYAAMAFLNFPYF